MSGHSHYATIKRQKATKDAAKGAIFSKLVRGIQIAVKSGGGSDPDANYKLRMAVDAARAVNMPKDNIDRAIKQAQAKEGELEEIIYEGFGPGGVSVIVEAATDNRNRTGQEIKNLFERGGGSLAGPGAVSFNFDTRGLILVKKTADPGEQMLKLIDAGVDDLEEEEDVIEVYISPEKLSAIRENLINLGFSVVSSEIVKRPKNLQLVNEPSSAQKVLSFLETLEDSDDVQKVHANIDIPDEVLNKIKS